MSRDFVYADVEHVQALLPIMQPLSNTSKPSRAQVEQFLEDASNELDAALAKRDYEVPFAEDSGSAGILGTWTAICAAAKTAAAMPRGVDGKQVEMYRDDCRAVYEMIAAQGFELPGTDSPSVAGAGVGVRANDPQDPYFVRDRYGTTTDRTRWFAFE